MAYPFMIVQWQVATYADRQEDANPSSKEMARLKSLGVGGIEGPKFQPKARENLNPPWRSAQCLP
ncbi:hypothetical protein [Oscillatoria acuminata]|uniref:Uncharacterized protein n=1 Tax=Oscillatoria acuminata PCC 6304 TaxID=56110 RepID=K9TDC7_9CYAN|nr:hypothetical protein [Oscillatoria acuminata]AFY80540.1 hypothetical protein Oscil6304_0805 [Oscillatoria acuminata PCC 6304]